MPLMMVPLYFTAYQIDIVRSIKLKYFELESGVIQDTCCKFETVLN